MIYVIRYKHSGEECQRFPEMSERGFRGLLMRVDSTRFKVGIHGTAKDADAETAKLTKAYADEQARKKAESAAKAKATREAKKAAKA